MNHVDFAMCMGECAFSNAGNSCALKFQFLVRTKTNLIISLENYGVGRTHVKWLGHFALDCSVLKNKRN